MGIVHTLGAGDAEAVPATAAALRAGEIVVLPTDTVYGLAALPDHPDAVRRIFEAKDRPASQHLPVLAASMEQVRRLGVEVPGPAFALADRWWPGPLTLVLGFTAGGRPEWLVGRDEVAVRIPRHPFLLALMAETGPLLVTSANQHGSATPPSAGEVATTLGPHVRNIVDGGVLDSAPSTLVNVRGSTAVVEREGAIPSTDITELLSAASGSS
jgi:L-threonylcarbamoyladenylate synthase